MNDGKAWVRQWIAIAFTFGLLGITTFALWGGVETNMEVFWSFFTVATGYIGWFFKSREDEKRALREMLKEKLNQKSK